MDTYMAPGFWCNAGLPCKTRLLNWLEDEYSGHCYREDPDFCITAAKYGQLEVLKWAVSNIYLLDSNVCYEAVKRDDFEMLEWLIDNNCPSDKVVV